MSSETDDPVATLGGAALATVVRAVGIVRRSARPLHPRGRVLRGVLHRQGATPSIGVPWLDDTREDAVLVRLSRGGGLPAVLPDVLGLAVRLDGGEPADLLFATTGRGPLTRFLLRPTWRTTTPMSTLMPFRTRVGPVVLGARRSGARTVELRCATLTGPWRPFGTLRLEADVDEVREGEQPELAFDPVLNQLPGLESYDWARRLRAPSYAAARAGRQARPDDSAVRTDDELADEMVEESFPGSDPPSTWAGRD